MSCKSITFAAEKRLQTALESTVSLKNKKRKGARVAEEARLESVYTSKAYRGFESPSFRYKSTDRQAMKPDSL